MPSDQPPVLILGAGVHGAAIARELVLNGVSVEIVEAFDIAFGATSKSSRLIHGGLRYLEYGDFRLVRESLTARADLLELAPQFVTPLRLHMPTSRRWSGLLRSLIGFCGWSRTKFGRRVAAARVGRGYWPLRIGLALYDQLAPHRQLPPSSAAAVGTPGTPRVDSARYRWLCSYSDAQMLYPERFVQALLADARQIAETQPVGFQLWTHARVVRSADAWRIHDRTTDRELSRCRPACVINATGAWGDATREQLQITGELQFGGTKGTHFLTWNDPLRKSLGNAAVYAEADDGRLVFILPFGDAVLVGTTDETFAASPESARATDEELDYLLRLAGGVMNCRLTRADIAAHYSGVRPLPRSSAATNAAVSRDHLIVEQRVEDRTLFTLVGGKLTTWREFAEQVTDRALHAIARPRRITTQRRPIPGSEEFPPDDTTRAALWLRWAAETGADLPLIAALWPLYGTRAETVLAACRHDFGTPIAGTAFTNGVVRWIIDHEWVRTLSDLVERRLMLVFAHYLSHQTLLDLAACLIASGKLSPDDLAKSVADAEQRLTEDYGRCWE